MKWLRSKKSRDAGQWEPGEVSDLLEDAPWSPFSDLDDDDDDFEEDYGEDEYSFEHETSSEPEPRKRGLLGRIFGRKKSLESGEYQSEFAPQPDEDGAPQYSPEHPFETGPYVHQREPKKGFVERISGRSRWWWSIRIVAGGIGAFFLLIGYLTFTAPLSKSLEPIAPPQITLLAADGTPIARKGAVVAEPVEIAKLPPHVVEAFLAIEDRRFYSHWGVDPRGVGRALWAKVSGGRMQGGSTITQQLAKFTFLSPEQTMTRKAREALIAFWLESWLTKDEILERYLSNAYFGDNMYGIRAASMHYYFRRPENLTAAQSAMLAGLLQAPSRLAPTRNPDLAAKRFGLVKGALVAAGYVTQAEADAMDVPRTDVRTKNNLPTGTYFADWVMPQVRAGSERSYASQTLTTTLDSRLQSIARRVINRAPLGDAQVAMVAMRTNGEVVAMLGGKNYGKSPFNRVTQAQRQPGSTFKLFVYLAALEQGWEAEDTIDNSEFIDGTYRPRNYNGQYSEEISLRDAFASSSNVAAVRLQNELGDDAVRRMALAMGVRSPLPQDDPSMALGTSTMNLLELTAAYAGVAAGEYPVTPHAFEEEEGGWFDWLWDGQDSIGSDAHEDMEEMLRATINSGTGRGAMLAEPNYGKTGTTQDNRDALFIGYAGDLVVGVWIGNDDNSPLNGVTGGGLPARIWRDFMRSALDAGRGSQRPARIAPTATPDPEGPVLPLDLDGLDVDGEEIPLGDDGSTLNIEGDRARIQTEIEGVPIEITFDEDGINLEGGEE